MLFDILRDLFPKNFSEEQKAKAQTLFYKTLSLEAHKYYGGKIQMLPKSPVYDLDWFNIWYTPGVSAVSTTIRDDNDNSFLLSNRSNLVAVVSDSTRVLGDGDCTPSGGLGVMEGKAMLMKYLGGVDAVALCIDSKDKNGNADPDKIINFVKTVQPSFGAINLEDISQPNCFKVLDVLREECNIPVWHDDAQGTACVTLSGVINALHLTEKNIGNIKIVLYGAGAANTSIARLLIADGAKAENIILFDEHGTLHKSRSDYQNNRLFYRQWELCQITNPQKIVTQEEAFLGADLLIALSKPGPDTIKSEWLTLMAEKSIVFVCANPVPEIYPYKAKEAGAYIVATGRGDFPNQVNNSICFPSILKGTLMAASSKITDTMIITGSHAIAQFARSRGINSENIIPNMVEKELFPYVAAEVAVKAIEEGFARRKITKEKLIEIASNDIDLAQKSIQLLQSNNIISKFPENTIVEIAKQVIINIK